MAAAAASVSLLLVVLLLVAAQGTAFSSQSSSSMASSAAAASAAVRARAKAAIVGGFVADAATMPLHWIYDAGKIQDLIKDTSNAPEFFATPSCPFYSYETGNLSPYGDEILPLLRHLAGQGNRGFEASGFAKESFGFLKAYSGRLNHVSKLFVEATEAGKAGAEAAVDDSQAHGIIKVPLIVGRYASESNDKHLFSTVEAAVRVHQTNELSIAASLALAKILNRLICQGGTAKDAIDHVLAHGNLPERERAMVEEAIKAPYPNIETIREFGWSCALPGALKSAIYTAYHAPNYVDGVRFSCLAGGDNCSRNIVVGALLAAQDPEHAVPASWREKTKALAEVDKLADAIVKEL